MNFFFIAGALYFVVLNTNRKFRSSLDCIFLSTLFYTEDIKHPHIGWKKILQPLNDDLEQLELVQQSYFCSAIIISLHRKP